MPGMLPPVWSGSATANVEFRPGPGPVRVVATVALVGSAGQLTSDRTAASPGSAGSPNTGSDCSPNVDRPVTRNCSAVIVWLLEALVIVRRMISVAGLVALTAPLPGGT